MKKAGSSNRPAGHKKKTWTGLSYSRLPTANDRNRQVHVREDVEQAIICREIVGIRYSDGCMSLK